MGVRKTKTRPRILIAGLGNVLLRDDGVGVHAVRELRKYYSPGTLAVEVGTAVLDAFHLFEWADRILAVDAMKAGGLPGTIYISGIHDIEEPGSQASLHELSLISVLGFLASHRRPEVMVLGIEPDKIDYGLDLSSSLQAVIPGIIRVSKAITGYWRTGLSLSGNTECLEALLRPLNMNLRERSDSGLLKETLRERAGTAS